MHAVMLPRVFVILLGGLHLMFDDFFYKLVTIGPTKGHSEINILFNLFNLNIHNILFKRNFKILPTLLVFMTFIYTRIIITVDLS